MAAVRHSPIAIRQWLVRLGHLCFDDFLLLLGKWGLSRESSISEGLYPFSPKLASDWAVALNNAPHIQRHFQLQIAGCGCSEQPVADRQPSIEDIRAAQERLVTHFALDLLQAKAPPLYDALPWHDWDFSIVTKRFRLWQTRFLLAGDGATVTMCRCRKSAGVYVVEPEEAIARYTERKAALEKVRRFQLLRSEVSSPGPQSPITIPLPDNSVDLAIIGSVLSLDTGNWKLIARELLRISHNVLLIENSPLASAPDPTTLHAEGFVSETVEVRSLGPRPCHLYLGPR